MLDLMYDLPEHGKAGQTYRITSEMVNDEAEATLFAAAVIKKESA